MVDTEQGVTATGKSILKRRLYRNGKFSEEPVSVPLKHDTEDCAGKRFVTFDETILVKNEKNLVVKKPLKLEIVIENWKSTNVNAQPEIIESNPGIVSRLVGEFNTIEKPLIDNPEIDSTSPEKDSVKEDEPSTEFRTNHIPLCETLEKKTTTAASKLIDGKLTLSSGHLQNHGRVIDLVNMFNSKSTNEKTERFESKILIFNLNNYTQSSKERSQVKYTI